MSSSFMNAFLDAEILIETKFVEPEFAESFKRRFTNVGISDMIHADDSTEPLPVIKLEDVFFEEDSNQITLTNITIEKVPIARIIDAVPKLDEQNIYLVLDWNNIVINCSYEMTNSSQLLMIPNSMHGKIRVIVERVFAEGLVGFSINKYDSTLMATNFNLNFQTNNVTVMVESFNSSCNTTTNTIYTRNSLDDTVIKHSKSLLFWKLKKSLKKRLDRVLNDFSLSEIFPIEENVLGKYVNFSSVMIDFINRLVDKFILQLRMKLLKEGKTEMKLPKFETKFSKDFGFLTFWGHFLATNGFISNLSTIKKQGPFSYSRDEKNLTLFGSIGFEQLAVRYDCYEAKIWRIGPRGTIKMNIGANNATLKITGKIENFDPFKFKIIDFQLKILRLKNIDIQVTGLGVALNWLVSKISTWVIGILNSRIVHLVERAIGDVDLVDLLQNIEIP